MHPGVHVISEGFDLGLYSYSDAARFIGARSTQLRRWMKGYKGPSGDDGQRAVYPPLWSSQWANSDLEGIGFRDLVELRFVRTFVDCGVPLQLIRQAIDELKDRLGREYPFTSTTFKTGGRRIFMELVDGSDDPALVDVVKRQDVMRKVIAPSFRDGIELTVDDVAARWFPLKGSTAVVLDPARHFGQPILARSGIPTAALADALQSETMNEAGVARWFDVPLSDVKQAIAFEKQVRR